MAKSMGASAVEAGMEEQDERTAAIAAAVRDGFASVREAERFLCLSRATVYHLMDSKQLQYAKFGKSRRIPWAALRAFAAAALVG